MVTVAMVYVFTQSWWFCLSNEQVNSFLIAVLYACVSSIVFKMFCAVFECSTDTIFYCMALEAEGGSARQLRFKELYDAAQSPLHRAMAQAKVAQQSTGGIPVGEVLQQMKVMCPPDRVPGDYLQVRTPVGTVLSVVVPGDARPGEYFIITY